MNSEEKMQEKDKVCTEYLTLHKNCNHLSS